MLTSACPIMPSRDFDATITFYAELGFTLGGRHDDYLILKKDDVELHFFASPEHDPKTSDHGAYLRDTDPRAWSDAIGRLDLPAHGIPRFIPAEVKPWGMLEFALIDVDGNLLRAGKPVGDGRG